MCVVWRVECVVWSVECAVCSGLGVCGEEWVEWVYVVSSGFESFFY